MNKPRLSWTPAEIETLRRNRDLTTEELGALLPDRTIRSISTKRIRLGYNLTSEALSRAAKKRRTLRNDLASRTLDQTMTLKTMPRAARQVILSGMFGDGGIGRNGAVGHVFRASHGEKQADYAKWKCKNLACVGARYSHVKNNTFQIMSKKLTLFDELRAQMYAPGTVFKRFPSIEIADQLDDLGFLLWWLDDGYLVTQGGKPRPYGRISCQRAEVRHLREVTDLLNKKLSMRLEVRNSKWKDTTCALVVIHKDAMLELRPRWLELWKTKGLPACMRYKLPPSA